MIEFAVHGYTVVIVQSKEEYVVRADDGYNSYRGTTSFYPISGGHDSVAEFIKDLGTKRTLILSKEVSSTVLGFSYHQSEELALFLDNPIVGNIKVRMLIESERDPLLLGSHRIANNCAVL